ncbi:MAG TPA: hypothetical protein VNT54_07470 [Solirubrobacteraceae bacterium]|nr:hypothetical protein [Solirubrobacteraceae bacterium]
MAATAGQAGADGAAAPPAGDALAGLLARAVCARTPSAPTLQRLVASTTFRERTSATLAVRGTTLEQLDKLLAEYHELVRSNAHLRPGPSMNRLQQILTEIRQDAKFWFASHANDTTSRGKRRRVAIEALYAEAQDELIAIRAARSAGLAGDVIAFRPQENAFLASMTGSASSILENLGAMIALAVPKPGDSVTAELSVRIPCDSYGVSFVGFRLLAEASRSDGKATKVRLEAAVTGGAQIAGLADIAGEFGFFLESHGATPQQAMKLISWGWYRQFREARAIPREVANFMWGGSTSSVGFTRAEQWAANVEKEAFKRDYDKDTALSSGVGSKATTNEYVRFGALAGIGAEVGGIAGSVFDVAGSASMSTGVHYDQTSVEQAKKGQANVGVPMKERARFNLKHLGSGFVTFDTAFSATVGPFSGEIGMALELMARAHREGDKDKRHPEGYLSIHGSLGLFVPAPKMLLSAIARGVKQLVQPLQNASDRIEIKAGKEMKGIALDATEDAMADALRNFPAPDQLEVALEGSESWASLMTGALPRPGSLTLSIAGGYQFGPSLDNLTLDVSLSHATGLGINASYVGVSLSRSSRLLRIVIAPGTTRTGRKDKWMIVVD